MKLRFVWMTVVWSVLLLVFVLLVASPTALGQGSKITSETAPVADSHQDNPQARELWFRSGRTVAPGDSAAAARLRAHAEKLRSRAARARQFANTSTPNQVLPGFTWSPLGPAPLISGSGGIQDYGPVSGRVNAVLIDPADPTGNTVYVGGAYGGLWRSQNAASGSPGNATGVTWTPLTDDQPTLSFGAIALQPGNINPVTKLSNVIIAGTGEANAAIDSYYGLGFLRSADGGNTWSLITSANGGFSLKGLAVSRLAFNTTAGQSNRVVAGVTASALGSEEGAATVNSALGIYASTDAGVSWTHVNPLDGNVLIDSTSATSVVYNAGSGAFFAAIRHHGIYSSVDGLTWRRLANQPGGAALGSSVCPAGPHSTGCPIYRGEIAVVPGRNEMYAWYVDDNFADMGIYRSLDGGSTWIPINESGLANCGDPAGCGTQQSFFNLDLAAVPDGQATDLYAGTVNEYRCTLLRNTDLSCKEGGWLNLTHVYGCAAIASVHPDQHAIDFKVVNGKSLLYFGNDGGVYRALDGYTGLVSGSCGGINQFDSLNASLGSMAQFVSFSQHPTSMSTMLGGTQDNGSPATSQALSSAAWKTANTGDGGYNEIDPSNPTQWFTANTDVSIQRCTQGINCDTQSFTEVVGNATVGGDVGGFYTPYILDPQAPGEMLVGTCRIWRGTSAGANFSAISNNFDTQTPATCTQPTSANIVHPIRAIAAGGPRDANGFSNVIYAATEGPGPLALDAPPGGQLFVTTNASAGPASWVNVTQAINPDQYTISSIAIDASDPTGRTAYVAIMGFATSTPAYSAHVWKTTNAGTTWTDFTGSAAGALPDAPANTLVIDSAANILYVGTDVGVFRSATASPNWAEVGPSSGAVGFLPNVPVTKLRIFSSGGQKLLRASTYGRGIWQFPLILVPDYLLDVSNSAQTIFPGQQASFSGTVTSFNGFTSTVALSCTTGTTPPPSTCVLSPGSVIATQSGAGFTLTTAGSIGDYVFNVHGRGADTNATVHDQPVSLHVVDFGLTAPTPSTLNANRPGTSGTVSFQVTAGGSFNSAVTLNCVGLPSAASCNFSPAAIVSPSTGSPVTVTVWVSTTGGTPVGGSVVTVSASSGAISRTQSFTLNVTANPDYVLTLGNSPQSAIVTASTTLNGTLTSVNGYNSAVTLACGPGAPQTCNFSPQGGVVPSANGAPFTVTLSNSSTGSFSFSVVGSGTDAAKISHSMAAAFSSLPDFTLPSDSGSATVSAGGTGQFTLNFAPAGTDAAFVNDVNFSCSSIGLPNGAACAFTPTKIAAGATAASVALNISAPASSASKRTEKRGAAVLYASLTIPLLFFALSGLAVPASRKRKVTSGIFLGVLLVLMIAELGCGGGGATGGGGGTPPPPVKSVTYTITIDASESSGTTTVQHSTTVRLAVQ